VWLSALPRPPWPALVSALAVVSSRRISAGIAPDPVAAAAKRYRHPRHAAILRWVRAPAPAWWSLDDWLADVADALTPEVCREFSVAPDTALAVARAHAAHADFRTGRGCRPTNERLVELARVSLSTVQRARRALEALGLVRRQVEGRSIMSREERLQAWRRGSSHRQVAAEFALCSRRRRAPKVSTPKVGEGANDLGADPQSVDGDTPPGAKNVSSLSHLRSTHLRRQTEKNEEEALRAPSPTGKRRRAGGAHPGAGRLADAVLRRLLWLAGVSPRRITPTLSRFARAGWTDRDVELAVRDVLARRSWKVPAPATLRQPAAYLAGLLREWDPADRPTAAEEWERELQRREDAYALQLRTGTPCRHGRPAGDVPSPTRGHLACPLCRKGSA
jgi:DNA-binding transcriptional ArsR family regulator